MPSTVANNTPGVPKLTRGRPFKLGTLTALNQAIIFSLSMDVHFSAKFMLIQVPQGTVTTAVLEVSIDGGATWAANPRTFSYAITGLLTGDVAAAFSGQYDVSGTGGALFRFGVTAGTITSSDVWMLVD